MKSKTCLAALAAVLGASLSFAVQAESLDYDYALAQYDQFSYPSNSFYQSGDDYRVGLKYQLPANFVLTGDYYQGSFRPFTQIYGDVYSDEFSLGLMYRIHLSERWDLLPNLSYDTDNIGYKNYYNSGTTYNGWNYGLGLRGLLSEQLELEAGLSHNSVGGSSNGDYIGLTYNFAAGFGVGTDFNQSWGNGTHLSVVDAFIRVYF